ncbi:MAG: glycosyltransferase [Methylococcales bacterium]|nr:glycosyltransferase [Methylococcales bacterium]
MQEKQFHIDKEMPLVSLIVRTKNRPALLQQALQSICEQTYPKIEIIVVNDGGIDVSEVISPFNCDDIAIVLVQFPVNLGRSKAANAGLDKATGEYIAFLDDDDWLETGHIYNLVQAIEKHPEMKVVYSGVRCVDGEKKPLPNHFGASFDATQLLAGNYIPIHAALFSKELLKFGCRVDESLEYYEDWDFWIQASMFTSFLFINEYSAVYRIDDGIQQSELGPGANITDIEKASLILFHKWLPRLHEEQLVKLMHTVQLKRLKEGQIAELEVQVTALNQAIGERDLQITALNQATAERDLQITALNQNIAERDLQITALNQAIAERDLRISALNQAFAERDQHITAIFSSTSWRMTSPLRWVGHQVKRIRHFLQLVKHEGGVKSTLQLVFAAFRREGMSGIRNHLRTNGTGSIAIQLEEGHLVDRNNYAEWVCRYDTLNDADREQIRASIDAMQHRPKISVMMPVYDPPLQFLDEAIWSVRKQLYSEWELCIADDASKNDAVRDLLKRHAAEDTRIRVVCRDENGHISRASNSALALVTGEFIALFDHDDLLPEHALFCVAETILANPNVGIIYSDEDKISQSGIRIDPYFKCDWNPELFLGHNLLSHLGVYRSDIVKAIGGFRTGYEGSQDYDLAARFIEEIAPEQIVHIPRVLYHWRILPGSTSMSIGEKPYALIASEKALNEHLIRRNVKGTVEALPIGLHRLRFSLPDKPPLVSIIIPTRNAVDLVCTCVTSIYDLTTYKNFEILLIDNGSDDPDALRYFEKLQLLHNNFRVLRDERPFNFSALNNSAVRQAKGEFIALLNNDIEVITPDWLSEMVSIAAQPGIGAVGAKLWYLNNLLQHGGVTLGLGTGRVAGHTHHNLTMGNYGYYGRAVLTQEISAVTAACLVVLKKHYLQVGGLNETDLTVAFNDIDFCLKLKSQGYRNVWTPFAELYHHESATRGQEDTPEKKLRHMNEILYMQQRWGELLLNDPAYSPNLTLDFDDFGLAWPPRQLFLSDCGSMSKRRAETSIAC